MVRVRRARVVVGDPALAEACPIPQQLLKLSGDVMTPDVSLFFFCDERDEACE